MKYQHCFLGKRPNTCPPFPCILKLCSNEMNMKRSQINGIKYERIYLGQKMIADEISMKYFF